MTIEAAACSTRGIREHNEDSFLLSNIAGGTGIEDSMESFFSSDLQKGIFCVADGMGGHAAGDVASQFIVNELNQKYQEYAFLEDADAIKRSFETIIKSIHADLIKKGIDDDTEKMGSTCCGIFTVGALGGFFNVGDSRVYRMRNGFLQQLSRDHSLSSYIPDAAKNIIVNAMGAGIAEVQVDIRISESVIVPRDIFLLCSDGVHGAVDDEKLEDMLGQETDTIRMAQAVVDEAVRNNSDDNCTAVIIKVL